MNNEEVTACGAATVGAIFQKGLVELPECSIPMEYEGPEGKVKSSIRIIGMSERAGG